MRRFLVAAGIICALVVANGCETQQPQQSGPKTVQIWFSVRASVDLFDVWEWYRDADDDGIPDLIDEQGNVIDPPIQVQCQRRFGADGEPQRASREVPWTYSLTISVLKAGTTVPVLLTSEEAFQTDQFNLTPYDGIRTFGQPAPPCTADEVCTPLGQLSAGSRVVMESTYDDPQRFSDPSGRFICPGAPGLGDPRLNGDPVRPSPPPFTVVLENGDTVIVKARKAAEPNNGLEVQSAPILSGFITVNGRGVVPQGNSSSTVEPGSGVNFSFTAR